jgi:hypothetical protein
VSSVEAVNFNSLKVNINEYLQRSSTTSNEIKLNETNQQQPPPDTVEEDELFLNFLFELVVNKKNSLY